MPTIVDELVVVLGLDGAKFRRGAAQATGDVKHTRDEIQKHSTAIEAAGNRAAGYFTRLRNEVLGLFAAFGAATGLQQFIKDTTSSAAATGRMAHNIGMSTESLSAWQGAAERAGGSAEGINGSFQGLTQQFQQFSLTGQSAVIPYFRALGVQISDAEGKMRPLNDIMLDLADRFSHMTPQRANAFGSAIGLDQGTINLLIQGRGAVEALLAQQRKLGNVTEEQAQKSIEFQNAMKDVIQTATTLGREILVDLLPAVKAFLDKLQEWITANREWLRADLVEGIKNTAIELRNFAEGVNTVVQSLGGWKTLTEVIFGLWAVTRVAGIVSAITTVGVALGPLGIAIAAVLAGLAAIEAGKERLQNLSTYSVGSPLWSGIPEEEQLKYENSPASRKKRGEDPGGSSFFQRFMDWVGGDGKGGGYSPTADDSMSPEQKAFLDALSRGESGGDYKSKNPDSTAHGRYQFINSTDAEVSAKTGITGEDPVSQDRKAWYLAATTYFAKTQRDLMSDLKSGGHDPEIADALKGVWPSLPGGSQQNTTLAAWLRHNTDARAAYGPQQRQTGTPGIPSSGGGAGPTGGSPHAAVDPFYLDPSLRGGASPAAVRNTTTNSTGGDTNTVSTHIGSVNVQTAATDSDGIARGIGKSLTRYSYVPMANTGLA